MHSFGQAEQPHLAQEADKITHIGLNPKDISIEHPQDNLDQVLDFLVELSEVGDLLFEDAPLELVQAVLGREVLIVVVFEVAVDQDFAGRKTGIL